MIYHEKCEERFASVPDGYYNAVITDPPFNVSELAGGEAEIGGMKDHKPIKREMGLWDFGYSPLGLIEMSARVVPPGGWLIIKSGDVNFGMVREFGERSALTLERYIEFLHFVGLISGETAGHANHELQNIKRSWQYMMTVVWKRTNPAPHMRLSTTVSTCEFFQVLRRLDEKGKPAKSVAFNWLGQNQMHNYLEGPRCQEPERLYWHKINDMIFPCTKTRTCNICAGGVERLNHPAQTPLYVWRWILERFTTPGMRVYDPYAGLGTLTMANKQSNFGLEIDSSEQDADYVKIHGMWEGREWFLPPLPENMTQLEMMGGKDETV